MAPEKINHEPMKVLTVNLPVEYLNILLENGLFNYTTKSEFLREAFKDKLIKELELRGKLRNESTEKIIEYVQNMDLSNPFERGKSKHVPLGNSFYPSKWQEEAIKK